MILRKTAVVSSCTLISRITGYFRDMIVAAFLGAGVFNDLLIIALRLPNLFRSLFAEGAFSAAFVPLLSKKFKQGDGAARKFNSEVQILLIIAVSIFSALMVIFMPEIIKSTLFSYNEEGENLNTLVYLSRIAFPYIICITLSSFYGGILQVTGSFLPFASIPVIHNLCFLSVPLFGTQPAVILRNFCYITLFAGIVEIIWIRCFLLNIPIKPKWGKPILSKDVIVLFKKMAPGIVGSGVTQINLLVNTIIASLVTGGISYIYYADRIIQLPLALIGTALGTVLLPTLSSGTRDEQQQTQTKAIEGSLLLVLPATAGIWALAQDIIRVLFEHGKFTSLDTAGTLSALQIAVWALPAFVMIKLLITRFHSAGDTTTPVKIALVCMLINIGIGASLVHDLGYIAVSISTVVAGWGHLILSIILLKRREVVVLNIRVIKTFIKCSLISILMSLILCELPLLLPSPPINLLLKIIIGGFIYIVLCSTLNPASFRNTMLNLIKR